MPKNPKPKKPAPLPQDVRDLLNRARDYIDGHIDHKCFPEAPCYGHKLLGDLSARLNQP